MKKCCLTCNAYALWDGDYCCTWHMKILSHTGKNYEALNPEKVIDNICDDFNNKYQNKKHLRYMIDEWNELNPDNKFIAEETK